MIKRTAVRIDYPTLDLLRSLSAELRESQTAIVTRLAQDEAKRLQGIVKWDAKREVKTLEESLGELKVTLLELSQRLDILMENSIGAIAIARQTLEELDKINPGMMDRVLSIAKQLANEKLLELLNRDTMGGSIGKEEISD